MLNLCNLVLVILTIILVHRHCDAQIMQEWFLTAHNSAGQAVGVAPLVWNTTVAKYAHCYANSRCKDCKMGHSRGPYGENLARSSGYSSIHEAVKMWVDEKKDHMHKTNTCRSGAVCKHYKQVVWRSSKRLGCAKVRCFNGRTFVVCKYDPPGNLNNHWPY